MVPGNTKVTDRLCVTPPSNPQGTHSMTQLVELPNADDGLGHIDIPDGCRTKNLTTSRLRDKVVQAMTMNAGARRFAAGYAATGGAAHGACLIEQRLLDSPQRTLRRQA